MNESSGVTLAVVGSREFASDPEGTAQAQALIEATIEKLDSVLVISGGAVGIDRLAVEVARARGIPVWEYLPENPRWAPTGYKDRNLLIVEACTHLLAVIHTRSTSYGAGWTADEAIRQGKHVERRVLGQPT